MGALLGVLPQVLPAQKVHMGALLGVLAQVLPAQKPHALKYSHRKNRTWPLCVENLLAPGHNLDQNFLAPGHSASKTFSHIDPTSTKTFSHLTSRRRMKTRTSSKRHSRFPAPVRIGNLISCTFIIDIWKWVAV